MKKRGGVLLVIGIIVLVLILLVAGVVIYLYNFHVFKTVRVCVGDGQDMKYPCSEVQNCIDAYNSTEIDISDAPEFLRVKLQEVLDEVVYCDVTCFVKDVRGIDVETMEVEYLDSCESGETEIALDIRGKEGLEILNYIKSRESQA
jgi:hypothetical protein